MRRAAALLFGLCLLWPAAKAALTSPAAVERYVTRHAGAGRPHGRP